MVKLYVIPQGSRFENSQLLKSQKLPQAKKLAKLFGQISANWKVEKYSRDKLSRLRRLAKFREINFHDSQIVCFFSKKKKKTVCFPIIYKYYVQKYDLENDFTKIACHQNPEKCRMRFKFKFLVPTHLLHHHRPHLYLPWCGVD